MAGNLKVANFDWSVEVALSKRVIIISTDPHELADALHG